MYDFENPITKVVTATTYIDGNIKYVQEFTIVIEDMLLSIYDDQMEINIAIPENI